MGDKQVRRKREWKCQRQRREGEHGKRGLGLELAPVPRERGLLRSARQRARPACTGEEGVPCKTYVRERIGAEGACGAFKIADSHRRAERDETQVRREVGRKDSQAYADEPQEAHRCEDERGEADGTEGRLGCAEECRVNGMRRAWRRRRERPATQCGSGNDLTYNTIEGLTRRNTTLR